MERRRERGSRFDSMDPVAWHASCDFLILIGAYLRAKRRMGRGGRDDGDAGEGGGEGEGREEGVVVVVVSFCLAKMCREKE